MVRSKMLVVLIAVISLSFSAIWPSVATAADIPEIVSLGQLQGELVAPGSMAIDAQGALYVADARGINAIFKYDVAGTLQETFASVPVSGLALAVNASGTRIYATDTDGRVAIIDGQTGDFINTLGTLDASGDIAVDAQGAVYVVDTLNRQILKYDATVENADGSVGSVLNVISGADSVGGQFRRIVAIAIDPVTAKLYASGDVSSGSYNGKTSVKVFSPEGAFEETLVDAAAFNGAMPFCNGITFGPDGLEFYLDTRTVTVRVRDRETGYLTKLSMHGQMNMPADIVYDASTDRLLVASSVLTVEIFSVTPPNKKPSIPVMISPIAGGETDSLTPKLRFSNSDDVGRVIYAVDLAGFPRMYTEENGPTESYVTTPVLVENSSYSWRVIARDNPGLWSGWSTEQSFIVNATDEAPTAPILSDTAASLTGSGVLSWSASTDPDPNDTVSYRVEVAEDITFSDVTLVAELNTTEIQLDTFADYVDMQDGINYVWRVSAIDTDSLSTSSTAGSFVYDTSVLKVSANLPDAVVSLSGNAAYAGNQVGVAPVEFRDMPAGLYTVVVERAGCEQFVAQVEIAGAANADISAVLDLAIAPSLRSDADLRVGKSKLRVGMNAAPFAVDFNNDGLTDLLVGDDSGALNLYLATSQRGSKVQYALPQLLSVAIDSAAVPFVADWNNDNRKDLLVGGADGRVMLFLQAATSSDLSPTFAAGEYLTITGGNDLDAGDFASPAVVDLDNDGRKDLVVGDSNGALLSYLNIGTDVSPVLAAAVEIGAFDGQVAPLFIDWDADGQRDLLISHTGTLKRCVRAEDGTFFAAQTLLSSRATLADPAVKFFVTDLDSEQGKDVFAGFTDGKVTYFRSAGRDYLPSVTQALLDKVTEVQMLATAAGVEVQFTAVSDAITAGDLTSAGQLAKGLLVSVSTGDEFDLAADELLEILSR